MWNVQCVSLVDMTRFASFRTQTIAEVPCHVIFFCEALYRWHGTYAFFCFFHFTDDMGVIVFWVCSTTPMSSAGTIIFSSFSIVLLCFDSIFASFYLGRVEWTRGESNPTVTQLPPATSASKSIQNRPRWPPQLGGEVPQNGPCFEPPPPRPPILTSFTMSNFAMLDSWLS